MGRNAFSGKRPLFFFLIALLALGGAFLPLQAHAAGFSATGSLATARYFHTATLLPDGRILIAGGTDRSDIVMTSAELYDPATGVFTATGSMTTPRREHTATVLPNGKVLIAGGGGITAELYDPATGVFTATGAQIAAHHNHTATLLPDGRVLIAGGGSAAAELYDPATGSFAATGDLTDMRSDHTATLLPGGKVLIAGGVNAGGDLGTTELYDPATGVFTATGAMLSTHSEHTAILLPGGKVLIAGGGSPNTAELYDPATGIFTATGAMTMTRGHLTATLLPSGKVLITGGYGGMGIMSSTELYDPSTGVFAAADSMTIGRLWHTATLLASGRVLITGGSNNILWDALNSAEVYDYADGAFTSTGNLTAARSYHTSTVLPDGKILLAGSWSTYSAELYDPAAGAFTVTGSLNTVRRDHTATLLPNGKVLLVGGSNPGETSSAELYDSASGAFTAIGSLITARYIHTATLLPNGKVLIAGGFSNMLSGAQNSAELYDPATGSFTSTGSLSAGRYWHTATLLSNGKVLLAGGGNQYTTAELYDPATGTFSSTGSLNAGRYLHTATLLPNGKVLVTGGRGTNGSSLASAELYDPETGAFTLIGSMGSGRELHTSTLLSSGKVLITGGYDFISVDNYAYLNAAELYDPAAGVFTAAASMASQRVAHAATLLPSGKVLVSGGFVYGAGDWNTAELYDAGLGFSDASRPSISSIAFEPTRPALSITGSGFRGASEASGGNYSSSATNYPILMLQRVDNEQTSFILSEPSTSWSDTSFTSAPLSGLPAGTYRAAVIVNAVPSAAQFITIAPVVVDGDGDGYDVQADCDDANPAVHPGAPELCDGIDNNCDGQIDEGLPPVIGAGPASLVFSAILGKPGPAAQSLNIANSGCAPLNWTASTSAAWLSAVPSSGVNAGTVTVSVNAAGLAAGSYNAAVNLAAADAAPVSIPVTFNLFTYARVCAVGCTYTRIQDAINAAAAGAIVEVGDGTYFENLNMGTKAITLRSVNGPQVTIIDGSQPADPVLGSVVYVPSSAASVVLDGFTLQNGKGYKTNTTYNYRDGGGVYAPGSNAVIKNCIIRNNWISGVERSSGGGILGGSPTIENCELYGNYAMRGAGISMTGGTVRGSFIHNNGSGGWGGGMNLESANVLIENCVVASNRAGEGGGIRILQGQNTISNCTIVDNGTDLSLLYSRPVIKNSVVWSGTDPAVGHIYQYGTNSPTITYSNIQSGWTGTGNINSYPAFLDPAGQDYRLGDGSPNIDAGDPAATTPAKDIAGTPRPQNGRIDMGAYEWLDGDRDGYGTGTDCDDSDPNTRPGAPEICDGRDNNCNGQVDESCSFFAPAAANDLYNTPEDTALTGIAPGIVGNDTAPNGEPLGATLVAGTAHGALVLNPDGSFTYTPAAEFHGTDSFTYRAGDTHALSNIATVTIQVASVNDAPVAADQALSTVQTVPLSITLSAADIDGNALTYTVLSGPGHGTLTGTPPNLTYNTTLAYYGPDSFSFIANDGTADSNVATISITVIQWNDMPAADAGPDQAASAGQTLSFSAAASHDPDGTIAGYSWNWGDGTAPGTDMNAAHVYAVAGTWTVTLTVTDNRGATATDTATITIAASTIPVIETYAGGKKADLPALEISMGIHRSAVGPQGEVYTIESGYNRIRRLDPDGMLRIFAGNGETRFAGDGGPARQASLYAPSDLAVDSSGNVYVADNRNNRIRKIDTNGVITTVAGNGNANVSGDNGPAVAAGISTAQSYDIAGLLTIALDPAGNLYIADARGNRIRKVDTNGIITTYAGTGGSGSTGDGGPATAAQISSPNAITCDQAGNLFISTANVIRRVDAASKIITTYAGNGTTTFNGDGIPALQSGLGTVGGMTAGPDGSLYLAVTTQNRVRRIDAAGIITTLAGSDTKGFSGDGGPVSQALLNTPVDVDVDASGTYYIGDQSNGRIRAVNGEGIINTVVGGTSNGDGGPATHAVSAHVTCVATDNFGNVYFCDGSGRIRKVDAQGTISTAYIGGASDLAVDAAGLLYFSDGFRINRIEADGSVSIFAGGGTLTGDNIPANQANISVGGMEFDDQGNLFFVGNNMVRKIDSNGILTTVAGTGTAGFSGDGGSALQAMLNGPSNVAPDHAGNVFVADQGNHRIRKIGADGIITTYAGNGSQGWSGDGGPATAATVGRPQGVAVDSEGNVYTVGSGAQYFVFNYYHVVRKIDTNGIISTVAGNPNRPALLWNGFTGDGGPATQADLDRPCAIAADGYGDLYIADYMNDRIRWVNMRPHAAFTATPDNGVAPLNVSFTNGTRTASGATYLWEFGDGTTSTEAAPGHLFSAGTYTVTLTATGQSGLPADRTTAMQTITVMSSITIATEPDGLSYTVDGATFTGVRTFNWMPGSTHTIATTSPQAGSAGSRYVFSSWSDGGAIEHIVTAPAAAATYTASFATEYQLTTAVAPAGSGTVTPAPGGWYAANTAVNLLAAPAANYVFVSWTGPVADSTGAATTVTMTGPQTVTANMGPRPSLTARIANKTGANAARVWTISLANSGEGAALNAQLTGLTLTQTGGSVCTPVITSPASFPLPVGSIAPGGSASANVTINFSSCSNSSRFTVTIPFDSNSGTYAGSSTVTKQSR